MKINSLLFKTLLPIVGILILAIVGIGFYLSQALIQGTIESSTISARSTIDQFKALRGYYTKNVVSIVKAQGGLKINYDHHDKDDTIPLPATVIHDMSELLSKDKAGAQLKLYSAFPFPNRASRTLDDFAEEAIGRFEKNPDDVFIRTETVGGQQMVRVAIADKLVAPGCVACHNSRPDTPKNDWKLGDVRGVLEVDVPIDAQIILSQDSILNGIISLIVMGVLIVMVVFFVLRRTTQSMKAGIVLANQLSQGDFSSNIKVKSGDEVGQYIESMNEIALEMSSDLQEIQKISNEVATNCDQITASNRLLAESTSNQASASEQVGASLETIASQAQQNSEHVSQADQLAQLAQKSAQKSNETVGQMVQTMTNINDTSQNISKIIKTIDEIAFQTNLLALNAAVEAARAGIHGKGFAVVANEVRNLAVRSAQAAKETTEMIENSINGVQKGMEVAHKTSAELQDVFDNINKVSDIIGEIASSISEQTNGIHQINVGLKQIEQSTQQNAGISEETSGATQVLLQQALALRDRLSKFKLQGEDDPALPESKQITNAGGSSDKYEEI